MRSTRSKGMPLWLLSAGKGIEEPLPLLESDAFAQMLDCGLRRLRLGAAGLHSDAAHGRCHFALALVRWCARGCTRRTHAQTDPDPCSGFDREEQAARVSSSMKLPRYTPATSVTTEAYGSYGQKKSRGDEEAKTITWRLHDSIVQHVLPDPYVAVDADGSGPGDLGLRFCGLAFGRYGARRENLPALRKWRRKDRHSSSWSSWC